MRKKYLYRVGLAILPVWMGRYIELVGEKSTDSVVNVLINGIFGRVTGDSGSRFVIAIGQAIFLVLFLILYGDCIAARQRVGAVYFSQEFQIEKNGLARNLSGYFCTVCFIQAVLWECTRCFRLWDAVKRVCQWRF